MRFACPLLILTASLATVASAQIMPGPTGTLQKGIPWRTFKTGAYSQARQPGLFVLNTQTEFSRYWQQVMGQPAATAPLGVNWAEEKLIAVHLGQRPTGGYSVFVRGITRASSALAVVRAVERPPVPGSFVTEALTSPFVILRVDRSVATGYTLSVETQDTRGLQPGGGPRCNGGCPAHCGG